MENKAKEIIFYKKSRAENIQKKNEPRFKSSSSDISVGKRVVVSANFRPVVAKRIRTNE